MNKVVVVLAVAIGACTALAQGPAEPWRTVETTRFRVHYPAPYEEWARAAAAKLDSVAAAVEEDVGYVPKEIVDVIVEDPLARANGSAWPFLGAPRMILWTNPPPPESVIGYYTDWAELLVVHEQTHLVHMLRPSRNPFRRFESRILPLGPIATRAPRWVAEGYATVVEGDLTGSGRPNSDGRAAILRTWARAGRLPSYAALSSDRESWMGMSMAYLIGSTYLEWLRDRSGPESLRNLWRRMTARRDRSFDDAFSGVFGESPAKLYARFRAETTRRALDIEDEVDAQDGEIWQDLAWTTGAPALSPDERRLAIVLRGRDKPSRLVVWKTADDEEAEAKAEKQIREMLERDPEDVAPVRTAPLRRKPEHELVARNGEDFYTPRWMPGGSILHVRYEPDSRGYFHPDLFIWRPGQSRVARVTRGADVRDADPATDGSWAVAVRNRFGKSQLVRVDLGAGTVSDLTSPSISTVVSRPRVSPDGARVAFVRHEGGRWDLAVMNLESREVSAIRLPDGATTVSYPEWRGNESILATVGRDGYLEIHDLDVDGRRGPTQITRSVGASLAPTVGDGATSLFFLGLTVDGYVLRRMDLGSASALEPAHASGLLGKPIARAPATIRSEAVPPSRPYGIGRQEWLPVFGGVAAPSAGAIEAGIRFGDVVGRLDTVVVGSISSSGGTDGAAIATAWRGWPVDVLATVYRIDESRSDQPERVVGIGRGLDADRSGIEIRSSRAWVWRGADLTIDGGLLADNVETPSTDGRIDERIGFARISGSRSADFGSWGYGLSSEGSVGKGRTGEDSWTLRGSTLDAGLSAGDNTLVVAWERNDVRDGSMAIDRIVVGGLAGSLVPEALKLFRIESPALPAGILLGDEHEMQRVSLSTPFLPLAPFWERHRVAASGDPWGEWLSVAGVELARRFGPQSILRTPGVELRLGVARVLDAPLRDETEWWIGLRFSP